MMALRDPTEPDIPHSQWDAAPQAAPGPQQHLARTAFRPGAKLVTRDFEPTTRMGGFLPHVWSRLSLHVP